MLRDKLVEIALQWQSKYGVAPQITSVISEFDAAMLVGMSESDYSDYMQDKTAVSKGADFVFNHQRYQVKANRPSGKPGSKVTMVPKATNYLWDKLIWILYDQHYVMLEAWEWDVEDYKLKFDDKKRISFTSLYMHRYTMLSSLCSLDLCCPPFYAESMLLSKCQKMQCYAR